ncbi:hypothetical protein [Neisseria sp. Ec49-e6-T10]|uniref:hypothetical protein n=1 Tax=Neisseria sp. Ec49-e6-T10 TaxID=3140744 RepID=UPI003EBC769A
MAKQLDEHADDPPSLKILLYDDKKQDFYFVTQRNEHQHIHPSQYLEQFKEELQAERPPLSDERQKQINQLMQTHGVDTQFEQKFDQKHFNTLYGAIGYSIQNHTGTPPLVNDIRVDEKQIKIELTDGYQLKIDTQAVLNGEVSLEDCAQRERIPVIAQRGETGESLGRKLDPDNPRAAYGYLLATEQVRLTRSDDGHLIPNIRPDRAYNYDPNQYNDDQKQNFSRLAGTAIGDESQYNRVLDQQRAQLAQLQQPQNTFNFDIPHVSQQTQPQNSFEDQLRNRVLVSEYVPTAQMPAPSYGQRFWTGLVNGAKNFVVEPVLQARDLAVAGAAVTYNYVGNKQGSDMWLPEMFSGTADAYRNGTSQTELLLGSNPITGIGVTSYHATRAGIEGRYGDLSEMAGSLTTGLAFGKLATRYGGYGLRLESVPLPSGVPISQMGAIGVKLQIVTPHQALPTPNLSRPVRVEAQIAQEAQIYARWSQRNREPDISQVINQEREVYARFAERAREPSHFQQTLESYRRYQQDIDFKHIESDVRIFGNGTGKVQGGHFSNSPDLVVTELVKPIGENGVIYGRVGMRQAPGEPFYFKTNNGAKSTLTPIEWSVLRSKLEMSHAFENKKLVDSVWQGESSGVKFQFNPPSPNVPQWRGFPLYE